MKRSANCVRVFRGTGFAIRIGAPRLLASRNHQCRDNSDRGYYAVYLEDMKTKIGEVDEEFIYESRAGDTFILGSNVWKMLDIDATRLSLRPHPGSRRVCRSGEVKVLAARSAWRAGRKISG